MRVFTFVANDAQCFMTTSFTFYFTFYFTCTRKTVEHFSGFGTGILNYFGHDFVYGSSN